ncbi:hypothetical protein AKJ16_DCAP06592 [Drosera capensis]
MSVFAGISFAGGGAGDYRSGDWKLMPIDTRCCRGSPVNNHHCAMEITFALSHNIDIGGRDFRSRLFINMKVPQRLPLSTTTTMTICTVESSCSGLESCPYTRGCFMKCSLTTSQDLSGYNSKANLFVFIETYEALNALPQLNELPYGLCNTKKLLISSKPARQARRFSGLYNPLGYTLGWFKLALTQGDAFFKLKFKPDFELLRYQDFKACTMDL